MQAFRGISFNFLSLSRAQPLLPAPALACAQPRACGLPAAGHLFLLRLNHYCRRDLMLSPPPPGSPCLLEETCQHQASSRAGQQLGFPPSTPAPAQLSKSHLSARAAASTRGWGMLGISASRNKRGFKKISWEMCCKQAKSRGHPMFALNGKGAREHAGGRAPAMERDGTKPGRRGGDF